MKYAIEHDIIDPSSIFERMEMEKRNEFLKKHPYAISQSKSGKWLTYLPGDGGKRIQRVRNTKKEIEDIVVKYWKEQEENPTLKEIFDEWNDRRLVLKKISPSTHLRNRQVFKRHYESFGKKRIRNITPEMVEDFLEEQIPEHDLTAKAFANLKYITKGFLKRAKKRKFISFNVDELFGDLDTSDTDFRKVIKEDFQEVFDEEEMPAMVDYLKENLDSKNMGILLMFISGIRVGELVALKQDAIEGNTIKIRRTETRYVLDGKYTYGVKEYPKSDAGVRTVVIPNDYVWLCSKIKQINPHGEYVFLNDSGSRMTTNCIRKRLFQNCQKLGIYQKSPHKIRKTYGTILLDNNVDNRMIIGQMGHSDISCTETHYHRNRRTIDKKSEILSSIDDFKTS